jgi:rhodanese-related sulfurtransferase
MKKTIVLLFALLAGCAQAEWKETPAQELLQRQAAGEKILLVDVRTPEEFAAGHVPGAINLPVDRITGDEPQLKDWKQKPVVIYCRSGRRSAVAAATLEKAGYAKLEHLSGDMQGWEAAGRPVAR